MSPDRGFLARWHGPMLSMHCAINHGGVMHAPGPGCAGSAEFASSFGSAAPAASTPAPASTAFSFNTGEAGTGSQTSWVGTKAMLTHPLQGGQLQQKDHLEGSSASRCLDLQK